MTDPENVDALRQTDEAVPLRKRPIPDQLDFYAEKLAAQINPGSVPRGATIAMGAAIVGMGAIATEVRKMLAEVEQLRAQQPQLLPEYGLRVIYTSTNEFEGAIAETEAEARAIIADLNADDDPTVISRELIQREVTAWRVVGDDRG